MGIQDPAVFEDAIAVFQQALEYFDANPPKNALEAYKSRHILLLKRYYERELERLLNG